MIIPGTECRWVRGKSRVQCRVISVYNELGGVAKVHIGAGRIDVVPLAELVEEEFWDAQRRVERDKRRAAREAKEREEWITLNQACIAYYKRTGERTAGMTDKFLAKAKRCGMI